MERVYHYTSIEVLKLILQNSTIRFNRFDLMDDLTETEGLPIELKKNYFLSSWVYDEEENIPQWTMYAPKGVRIELPVGWYKKHLLPLVGSDQAIEKIPLDNNHLLKNTFFPLPINELFKKEQKFVFCPPIDENDGFMVKVEYSKDFSQLKQQYWKPLEDRQGISLSHQSAPVKYKDIVWNFQNEFRYYLMGICKPEDENEIPEFKDLPIDEKAIRQIRIRTYPNCSIEHWKEVLAVFSKRFPTLAASQHLERSRLDGKYKPKS